jgi:flagellar motor switch protein FliG
VGERKAQAILKRIGAEHKRVLTRVKQLVSERPQDVARVLVQEEPDRAAMLVQILGEEALSEVPDPVATEIVGVAAGRDEVNKEDAVEVLEAFERVLMVLKYVANGGVKFAQGALEKSLGPRKTQALFDRATGMSGFLKLRHLASDQVREVVSGESTETIAAVLSQLESVQAIGVLHGLDSKVQADVIGRLNAGSDVSPETRRDLDAWLADRVDTVIES